MIFSLSFLDEPGMLINLVSNSDELVKVVTPVNPPRRTGTGVQTFISAPKTRIPAFAGMTGKELFRFLQGHQFQTFLKIL